MTCANGMCYVRKPFVFISFFYLSRRPTWQMVVQLTALNIGMVIVIYGCNHVFFF